MNKLREVYEGIAGCIIIGAIAFTVSFGVLVSWRAGTGHHMTALFALPYYLPESWQRTFYGLWAFYWLALWYRVIRFLRDPEPAKKVYGGSWAIAIFLALISYCIPHLKSPLIHRFMASAGTLVIGKALSSFFGFTFPLVCLGAALLVIADKAGLAYTDPLERELNREVDWKRRANHLKFLKKPKKGMTYLGFEPSLKKPVFLSPWERNEHVHVVGTTGSGKTRYVLFPMLKQDIEAGRGVIFIDAKASDQNARIIQQMVTKAGRKDDFLFFSLSHLDRSRTYNPLQHGDASQLKDKIMAIIEWSEPYYKGVCRHFLQSLFMELDGSGKRLTLPELHRLIKDKSEKMKTFQELSPEDAKNITSVRNEIGSLVNTHFGGLLSQQKADIDLLDAYKNQKIVYFALDTQSYPDTAAALGRIITQDLKTASGIVTSRFEKKDLRSMAVYIDEFQAFGTRGFVGALSQCREAGFGITIAHQSLGDLKTIDPAYCQQVNDNTNTKIFLRVNDPETAQAFSDFVGTQKTVETTRHIHLRGQAPTNTMGSQKVVQEYRIHPTEVKNLETGQAVFKSGRFYGRLLLNGHFPDTSEAPLPEQQRQITVVDVSPMVPGDTEPQEKILNKV